MANAHRKRVQRFDLPGHCHELTFSCHQRRPLLTLPAACEELAVAIDRANQRHGWRLAAFVFMPEHVHLLVHPTEGAAKISDLLFAIKRPFSFRMKKRLETRGRSMLDELTIPTRPGVTAFRFWQEGPGYDRNLTTEKGLLASINYIHRNPVRRGLCEVGVDWRWSSCRWYAAAGKETDERLPTLTPLPAGYFHIGSEGTVEL